MEKITALITGATSGIGAAYAERFAKEGYNLILTGRRAAILNGRAEQIHQHYGVIVDTVLVELSNEAGIDELIQRIGNRPLDVLVNNAGFGASRLLYQQDLDIQLAMVAVHVSAPVKLIHAVLPGMVARKKGIIINISSESALLPFPKNCIYSGTKAFVKTFSEGLHLDLMGTGVQVQVVCPGLTRTDFHEKMGMEKSRQRNRGMLKWMIPEEVVDISLRDLRKNKVVCIPGNHTKMLVKMLGLLPRNSYYRFVHKFTGKKFSQSA
ncbi:MAG TPA: NAD(P)-dependent oxidoreductase [Firmicutes bacterium]|jgi:uncharacterized protein|nr:NAD(P)-dependent oxidoreductase [Bacillota bacterium]